MTNNILGVDLKIDQEYIAKCVKEVVNASMVEALGAKNEMVETVVKEILDTKVDRNGKIGSGWSYDEKLIDYTLRTVLCDVVKETIKETIEEKRKVLKEMIRNELNKKANMEKFVDSFINNTTKTLENSWRTKINIDFEKVEEED